MSSNERYFRLNPECFLVPGVKRAVIHNLYTGEALWCDAANASALLQSELNRPVDADSPLYRDLEQRQWGFFSDAPPYIDKLRSFNVFREKRIWRETPFISMAVLQVSNRCERACASCRTAFCPICTVFDSAEEAAAPLSTDEWCALIDQLARYGTKHIVFTGGDALSCEDLPRLILQAARHGIAVQVHTSGRIQPDAAFPKVAFSILLTDERHLPEIVRNFAGHERVTILSDGIATEAVRRVVDPAWNVMLVSARPFAMSKDKLASTDFERFFARRTGDGCLNGKITVGFDGRVLPCFGHKGAPVADLRRDGVPGAVKILMENHWTVSVDKRDANRSCTHCEFRYCCPTCAYYDPGDHCGYDVVRGEWMEGPHPVSAAMAEPKGDTCACGGTC